MSMDGLHLRVQQGSTPGIFTRTIVESPVTKWILHARIRDKDHNDVAFIGEHLIHIKQVCEGGHLRHVITHPGFGARILAAKVFDVVGDQFNDLPFIKREDSDLEKVIAPPQLLILTLASGDLVFLYLQTSLERKHGFMHRIIPIPRAELTIFQIGEHLAVDADSRAVAAAASQREVMIWAAKSRDTIQQLLQVGSQDPPLHPPRLLTVDGIITHMEFLIPSIDDADHIILLLIVINKRKVKAVWIDWYLGSDIHHAQIHPPYPLEPATSVPGLLIPLCGAAFVLICGREIKRWKNILSGSPTAGAFDVIPMQSEYPGMSPRQPTWASWCRPLRSTTAVRNKDTIYLAREDGLVYLLQIAVDNRIQASSAGNFHCHVGSAFASLAGDWGPDLLAVVGETSSGRVVSIGQWPSIEDITEKTWAEAMEMDLVETIPNWTSITDMICTSLPQSHHRSVRSRDGIFVTSGKQPFGAVSELRRGFEASQVFYFEDDFFKSIIDAWVIPHPAKTSFLLVLSDPTSTTLLEVAADGKDVFALDASLFPAFDVTRQSLLVTHTAAGHIIQITDHAINVVAEDPKQARRQSYQSHQRVVAAVFVPEANLVVTGEHDGSDYLLHVFEVPKLTQGPEADGMALDGLVTVFILPLDAEPLAMTTFYINDRPYVAVASADGQLRLVDIDVSAPSVSNTIPLPDSNSIQAACDHIETLRTLDESKLLLVCGLRDGRTFSIVLTTVNNQIDVVTSFETVFGQTTVKITALDPWNLSLMCGLETCHVSWTNPNSCSLDVQNIWITDKHRPELSQGPATVVIPTSSTTLSTSSTLAGAVLMICGGEIMVTWLSDQVTTIPRHIPTFGTPIRLIYAEHQKSIVVASIRTDVRNFPMSSGRSQERRQVYPVIEFIPSRKTASSFTYIMQPGEMVNALVEWPFQKPDEDKLYSFVLVAGSYIRRDGVTRRGRITFIQPKVERWEVKGVNQVTTREFAEPIWALVMLDESSYVASMGDDIVVSRYVADQGRWEAICEPLRLASRGVCITTSANNIIHISTAKDSTITLKLENIDRAGQYGYRLVPVSAGPRAALSLSHLAVQTAQTTSLTLLSTRDADLYGLASVAVPEGMERESHALTAPLQFHATLPTSFLRLRVADPRPKWSLPLASTMMSAQDATLACTTDGALSIVAPLPPALWRRLFWLQRLIEWDSVLSPQLSSRCNLPYLAPPLDSTNQQKSPTLEHRILRSLPIGLSQPSSSLETSSSSTSDPAVREPKSFPILCLSHRTTLEDKHINGDILARLFCPLSSQSSNAPEQNLSRILHSYIDPPPPSAEGLSQQSRSKLNQWMTENIHREEAAIPEIVHIVRVLCQGWL